MTLSFSLSLFVADGGRVRRFLRRHRRHFRNKIDSRLLRHRRLTSRLANRSRLVKRCKFCLARILQNHKTRAQTFLQPREKSIFYIHIYLLI